MRREQLRRERERDCALAALAQAQRAAAQLHR